MTKLRYIGLHMPFVSTYPYDLPFLPPKVNLKDERITNLLIKTRAELGELKGYSFSLPNPLLLLSPAIIKESLASSEIENINTTLIDVLENQLFPEIEQRTPDKEVLRYRDAVLEGFETLQKYSISTRTILNIQKTLLPNSIGTYRQNQNGIQNSLTKEIIYTPPLALKIPDLMGNLENFIHAEDSDIDPLIKCAILHYQFEAIHPFEDGNGRTGRILMVLYLVNSKILSLPILYISGYINANRNEYYKNLLNITKEERWIEYILFTLQGFYLQAKETKEILFKIMSCFINLKKELKTNHRKIYSADLAEAICSFPIVTPAKLATELGIHRDTAANYLNILTAANILIEKKVGKYHFYSNKELINILHT